jgi:hypothetical protein
VFFEELNIFSKFVLYLPGSCSCFSPSIHLFKLFSLSLQLFFFQGN